MYIKIKHIKQILLISACIFFAGFNYLTYVKAANTKTDTTSCDKSTDSDCDGLTNAEEKLYSTNPNNPDTDGDGYSDGVEVKSGYDPTKPAPGDKITKLETDNNQIQNASNAADSPSLTQGLIQELQTFKDSKGNEPVSSTDLQSFMSNSITEKAGAPFTWDTLPDIDKSQIKILKQSYSSLSDIEKSAALQKDANAYVSKVAYILFSNAPTPILVDADIQTFAEDFQNHLASISTVNPDTEYFTDLGNRLELFSNQINEIEVPESLIDLHIKFLRLMKGYLSLREAASPKQDSLAGMIVLKKISNLTDLTIDFFGNDVQNYFTQIQGTQK